MARGGRIREDAAIGIFFAAAFALGIVLISTRQTFQGDLTGFLIGNLQGVSAGDIAVSAAVGLAIIVVLAARAQGAGARLVRPHAGIGARLPGLRARRPAAGDPDRDDRGEHPGGRHHPGAGDARHPGGDGAPAGGPIRPDAGARLDPRRGGGRGRLLHLVPPGTASGGTIVLLRLGSSCSYSSSPRGMGSLPTGCASIPSMRPQAPPSIRQKAMRTGPRRAMYSHPTEDRRRPLAELVWPIDDHIGWA